MTLRRIFNLLLVPVTLMAAASLSSCKDDANKEQTAPTESAPADTGAAPDAGAAPTEDAGAAAPAESMPTEGNE